MEELLKIAYENFLDTNDVNNSKSVRIINSACYKMYDSVDSLGFFITLLFPIICCKNCCGFLIPCNICIGFIKTHSPFVSAKIFFAFAKITYLPTLPSFQTSNPICQ